MEPDIVEGLSESKNMPIPAMKSPLTRMSTGISLLEVQESSPHDPQFMDYNGEPPPAPKIFSKGVVATDITGHFTQATESVYFASGHD